MSVYVFKMPDIGEGIVEAEIVEWHVNVGDKVDEDAPLADVMTDKATVEITSPVSGSVTKTGANQGEKIVIGAEFVVFETDADFLLKSESTKTDFTEELNESNESAKQPVENQEAKQSDPNQKDFEKQEGDESDQDKPRLRLPISSLEATRSATDSAKPSSKVLASPAVRLQARTMGVPLELVTGTGPGGRVLKSDLPVAVTPGPQVGLNRQDSTTERPIVGLRRLIGDRLTESKRAIPHFTYVEEVDVTQLVSTRQHLNNRRSSGQPKLSILHFVLLGVCQSVRKWPQCNAHYDDQEGVLTEFSGVHLGVATMTDSGLMVPVVRHAEMLDLWEMANAVNRLAEGARAGTLSREELTGSTVTVTSLGALAGITTTPIINRPETTIIGPNKITDKLVLEAGSVVSRKVMNISSSFDHRIVDGLDAAQLIQCLREKLENPAALFVA